MSEAALLALLLAFAALLAVRSTAARAIALAVALLALAAVLGVRGLSPHTQRAVGDRPVEVRSDGYLSSDACRSCHPDAYQTWHDTYHRTMTQLATPQSVVGEFDDVILEQNGTRVRLERAADAFWMTLEAPGQPAGPIRRRVVLVTGSHHMQVYWYASGKSRVLGQLPFVYLIRDRRWIPRTAAFLRPPALSDPSETGRWNRGCIQCHSTHGKPRDVRSDLMFTEVAEFGISCEACHGPGEEHVQRNQNPLRRYSLHLAGAADPTIVAPERLEGPLASQVCGQCHGIWEYPHLAERRYGENNGFRYRPGDDLDETRFVVRAHHVKDREGSTGPPIMQSIRASAHYLDERFWSDGMPRTAGREYNSLLESPCSRDDDFSCMKCHDLHRSSDDLRTREAWANDLLAPGMAGDEACLQCHESFRARVAEHAHHEPDSAGARCYNCHMPFTTYGLLGAVRSHQVDSPDVAASLETGRPNACNQCHLDQTLGWAAEHLERWWQTPQPELSDEERSVAAAVLWLLRGDAGQRALMAWSLGWRDAREVSGSDWMAPYLAQLLDDPYGAVRYIAQRSLRSLPGFEGLEYDFMGEPDEEASAGARAFAIWARSPRPADGPDRSAVLVDADGALERARFERLLSERDDRRVVLTE